MNILNRFAVLFALALASVLTGTAANAPINIEIARSHSAAGAFGCTVSGASVATPSVITCAAAHNLISGDQVQITGIGGTTTDNTLAYANVLTATTFSIYSDAALTMGITGTGTYTSGGKVGQAWDISGWAPTGADWTAFITISGASGGKSNVCLQDSVDGFVNDVQTIMCVNQGTPVAAGTQKTYSWRAYEFPSLRTGVTNARIRLTVQSQDSGATVTTTAYLK
jgi:hypothetical protein